MHGSLVGMQWCLNYKCTYMNLCAIVYSFCKGFFSVTCASKATPCATWHHHTSVPSCSYHPPPCHCHTPPPHSCWMGPPYILMQNVKWAGVQRRYQCKDKTETDNRHFVGLKNVLYKIEANIIGNDRHWHSWHFSCGSSSWYLQTGFHNWEQLLTFLFWQSGLHFVDTSTCNHWTRTFLGRYYLLVCYIYNWKSCMADMHSCVMDTHGHI